MTAMAAEVKYHRGQPSAALPLPKVLDQVENVVFNVRFFRPMPRALLS
jgi:hypothetical protein